MEMGNMSKRQQPDQNEQNNPRSPMCLQHSEKSNTQRKAGLSRHETIPTPKPYIFLSSCQIDEYNGGAKPFIITGGFVCETS